MLERFTYYRSAKKYKRKRAWKSQSLYTLDIIVFVSFAIFQTYNITSCDASCKCGHTPLFYSKEKEKRKLNQEKQIKIKEN